MYDKPKELREFTSIWTDAGMKCKHKEQRQMMSTGEGYEPTKEPAPLKKPPQSWCYVEEG